MKKQDKPLLDGKDSINNINNISETKDILLDGKTIKEKKIQQELQRKMRLDE